MMCAYFSTIHKTGNVKNVIEIIQPHSLEYQIVMLIGLDGDTHWNTMSCLLSLYKKITAGLQS